MSDDPSRRDKKSAVPHGQVCAKKSKLVEELDEKLSRGTVRVERDAVQSGASERAPEQTS